MALSQIIVTSRYLKSGSTRNKTKRKNYTKYIATRETVEVREQNKYDLNTPTTKKQKELLSELLQDFPEEKRYLEYEDYTANPTTQNTSELINTIIERHADVIGNRQNFVGYMAKRSGAEQRGAHGLFTESDEPIVLNRVAEEVAHHEGNVWSHVVSLRREDAVRLGYVNSDRWRELVKRHISEIAEQTRIPMCNLKWYAAFHDTTHHPHIHLIVYSTNPKQGYLTKEGIEKIRSVFANDIFHDDLQSVYQEQTVSRDQLKALSQQQVHEMVTQIQQSDFHNPQLERLTKKLHGQLQTVSGKKVYGYLPQNVKNTVNEILSELAKDEKIAQLYEKWCELERLKHKVYTQKEPELPSLAENKVFKPVKNMIIRTVLDMNMPAPSPYSIPLNDDSDLDDNPSDDVFTWSDKDTVEIEIESFNVHMKWSDEYKKACSLYYKKDAADDEKERAVALLHSEAEKGNLLAIHDLGKVYAEDKEKSFAYYKQALDGFLKLEKSNRADDNLLYRLGRMYRYGLGTDEDIPKGLEYFIRAAELGNTNAKRMVAIEQLLGEHIPRDVNKAVETLTEFAENGDAVASYRLGRLYLLGADGVERDVELGKQWLKKSAEDGNEYAQELLDNMEQRENAVLASSVFGLFVSLSRMIEDDYNRNSKKLHKQVDSKIQQVIRRHKQELGIKDDMSMQ